VQSRPVGASQHVFGATWNNQGIILFVPVDEGPICKVRATGGLPEPVIKIKGHEALRWPTVMAGFPRTLFQTRIIAPRIVLFQYAVSRDGERLLINSLPAVGAAPLTVLVN
jgi:hypothetical protein